jgi:hypothetical protein
MILCTRIGYTHMCGIPMAVDRNHFYPDTRIADKRTIPDIQRSKSGKHLVDGVDRALEVCRMHSIILGSSPFRRRSESNERRFG